jgi:uncharacterized protein YprB with RNaseH-like and TPR domain
MKDELRDRLARLSALRPVTTFGPAAREPLASPPHTDLLAQLPGAECRNRYGRHIQVRKWFAAPRLPEISPRSIGRLFPGADESILQPGKWLFLDTETTGLAGGTGTYAFLVGIAWWEEGGLVVQQYFMRDYDEEPSLLLELARPLAERRILVTFNGKSFDWPLLQTRYRINRVTEFEEPVAHLDLLHPARQLWRLRLNSVALAELERRVLGIERGHDIPSETIPRRYFDFLRGGPAGPVAEVFRHNQMDLCGLASLAVHITALLHEPENCTGHAEDIFGISKLLQRRGENYLAGQMYQRALEGKLPQKAMRKAQMELAVFARRQRDFERSNNLWEQLLGDSPDGLHAYEQLAIYYEHHAREPVKAASLARDALVSLREALHAGRISQHQYRRWHTSFQHRLNRLTLKIR